MTTNAIYRVFTEHLGGTRRDEFIGDEGDIFYDPTEGSLFIGDGHTAGGLPITANGSAYMLPVATQFTLGGVKIDGTTITIANGVISSSANGGGGFVNNQSIQVANVIVNGNIYGTVAAEGLTLVASQTAGDLTLAGGTDGGRVIILAGPGTIGGPPSLGGEIFIEGGAGQNGANGGDVSIAAGGSTLGDGGDTYIDGGQSTGPGIGGNTYIRGGSSFQGNGGHVLISGGQGNAGVDGGIYIGTTTTSDLVVGTPASNVVIYGNTSLTGNVNIAGINNGFVDIGANASNVSVVISPGLGGVVNVGTGAGTNVNIGNSGSIVTLSGNVLSISTNGSVGTAGQVLSSNGSATYWANVSGGSFTNGQSITVNDLNMWGNGTWGNSSAQILTVRSTVAYLGPLVAGDINAEQGFFNFIDNKSGGLNPLYIGAGLNGELPANDVIIGANTKQLIIRSSNTVIQGAVVANGSVGTAGQVLTTNGSSTYWATVSGGGGFVNGQSISVNSIAVSTVDSSMIPTTNVSYDLGNTTNAWRSLYLSSNTIYLDGVSFSVQANGQIVTGGNVEYATIGYVQGAVNTAATNAYSNAVAYANTRIANLFATSNGITFNYDANTAQWTANVTASGGGSNVDLANVSSSIIPSANLTYNIGTANNTWSNTFSSFIWTNNVRAPSGILGIGQANDAIIRIGGPNGLGGVQNTSIQIGSALNSQVIIGDVLRSGTGNGTVGIVGGSVSIVSSNATLNSSPIVTKATLANTTSVGVVSVDGVTIVANSTGGISAAGGGGGIANGSNASINYLTANTLYALQNNFFVANVVNYQYAPWVSGLTISGDFISIGKPGNTTIGTASGTVLYGDIVLLSNSTQQVLFTVDHNSIFQNDVQFNGTTDAFISKNRCNAVSFSFTEQLIQSSNIVFDNTSKIVANGSAGNAGQVLSSTGSTVYWSAPSFTNGQSISVIDLNATGNTILGAANSYGVAVSNNRVEISTNQANLGVIYLGYTTGVANTTSNTIVYSDNLRVEQTFAVPSLTIAQLLAITARSGSIAAVEDQGGVTVYWNTDANEWRYIQTDAPLVA